MTISLHLQTDETVIKMETYKPIRNTKTSSSSKPSGTQYEKMENLTFSIVSFK